METEITRRLGHTTVDAVLTVEKLAIQDAVLSAAQKTLDELGVGVRLTSVNIGSVTAPPDAVAAFRDVASAQADSARIVSEAESYANDLVPRARGEAQQMLESSAAYRNSIVDQARGRCRPVFCRGHRIRQDP